VEIMDILKVKSVKVFNSKRKGFAVIVTETKKPLFTEFDLN
jgi:hypothetical protein